MITLYQFPRSWDLPNASPFCLKAETYLRIAHLEYKNRFVYDPRKSPKGKLPYIKIDDKTLPDSELLIDGLKQQFGDQLDAHLTDEQRALSVMIDLACTERLYWVVLYFRWQDDAGWADCKDVIFAGLPGFMKLFIPRMIRKKMIAELHQQGLGRHSRDEIIYLGKKLIDALACQLGDKKYFMGDKVSSIDATTFGFLANCIWGPLNPITEYVRQSDSIKAYCCRIWDEYYPDIPRTAV